MNSQQDHSLLSYLQNSQRFRLELSIDRSNPGLFVDDLCDVNRLPMPIRFVRLQKARLLTDNGSEILKILLFQQSDEYHPLKDPLWKISNRQMDHFWQQAFSELRQNRHSKFLPAPIFLNTQNNDRNELAPSYSLFYCIHKGVYFHPPCPHCGAPLLLCRDELLLQKTGLASYENTLERYLYCPSCYPSQEHLDFFLYHRPKDAPLHLKDCAVLIAEFGRLLENPNTARNFPCLDCSDNRSCYAADRLALSRIIPYSFYPFYFLIFRDEGTDVVSFLKELSGGPPCLQNRAAGLSPTTSLKENEEDSTIPGLHKQPSFFRPNFEKYFPEILYLKLTFLGQLSQWALSSMPFSFVSFPWTFNQVRVVLGGQGSLLPAFWNFRLQIFQFGVEKDLFNGLPDFPPANSLYFLANAWFFTLLVNSRNTYQQIQSELGLLLPQRDIPDKLSLFKMNNIRNNKIFAPENIFYDPNNRSVNPRWRDYWLKALHLGRSLLIAGLDRETSWSSQRFQLDLESLRRNLQKELFEIVSPGNEPEQYLQHPEIAEILSKIVRKWNARLSPPINKSSHRRLETNSATEKSAALPSEIFSVASDPSSSSPFHDVVTRKESVPSVNEQNEYIQETTIIAPSRKMTAAPQPEKEQEYISETLIIRPSAPVSGNGAGNLEPLKSKMR